MSTALTAAAQDPQACKGHARLAQALLDPQQAAPAGLKTWNGSDPGTRWDVYRNNVMSSLTQALADTFPVVCAMVGVDFFQTLTRHYIRRSPPRSPVLQAYGDGMAAFIAHYEPAASLPYLPDLARLEWARLQSLHAADAEALPHEQWSSMLAWPEFLVCSRVSLHPSLQVVSAEHAVVSLWAAHQDLLDIGSVDPFVPESALVFRVGDEVRVAAVTQATARWMLSLARGRPLGLATEDTLRARFKDGVPFDMQAALQLLIQHGLVTACHTTETPP